MKTFINKTFLAVVATVLVAGTAFFTSCEKEEKQLFQSFSKNSSVVSASIPYYSTEDQVFEIIDKISTFETLEELLDYEKTQGRSSIGAISEVFYENIDKESFSNQDEIITFYQNNSHLLDTFVRNNEIYITTKYSENSFRYVANQDGLFSIGDCVFRLFKNSVVSTSENNLNLLLNIIETDIEMLDTAVFKVSKKLKSSQQQHEQCYYQGTYGGSIYNGNTKFEMELE